MSYCNTSISSCHDEGFVSVSTTLELSIKICSFIFDDEAFKTVSIDTFLESDDLFYHEAIL